MSDTTMRAPAAAGHERPAAAGSPPGVAARDGGREGGAPDLREHGAPVRGVAQTSTRRLFVQLHVFTECPPPNGIIAEVRRSGLDAVVYADLNDPRGIGVLLMSEDPALFAEEGRELLSNMPFRSLTPRPEMTMIGRTYSSGRKPTSRTSCCARCPATCSVPTIRGPSGIRCGASGPSISFPAPSREGS